MATGENLIGLNGYILGRDTRFVEPDEYVNALNEFFHSFALCESFKTASTACTRNWLGCSRVSLQCRIYSVMSHNYVRS